ncbi:MAG: bifunctional phosphopantothenoylcysteine decarboxylase/phosphopantothenate--cysteine ligase CoaBC, partial [Sedimenticolaceae bacterium]
MQPLSGRRVLLGISAGIAAYKAAELARLLVKEGAQVQVVMTRSAAQFIGPMTFQAITGRVVRDALFDPQHEAAMGHIELARWAELILVAPATADFLAHAATGMAHDLLCTLCLASTAPLMVAPAMNQAMWRHAATQANAGLLKSRGVVILGPDEGAQACGDSGPGRMLEPEAIAAAVRDRFVRGRLAGR